VFLLKLAVAVYAMSAVLWLATPSDASWLTTGATARAANLTYVVVLGAASYFTALWLLGFRIADFSKRAAE
jgi:putative peptidoglycan lipid II flippase